VRDIPPDDADGLTWLLFRQHDVITWAQARRFVSESAMRHRLRTGRWRQVHREIYVAHNGPIGHEQKLWIAVLATGAVTAGPTALAEYGLRRHSGSEIRVITLANRRPRHAPAGVVVHRTSLLPSGDIHEIGDPPKTMPARSVVGAAQWAQTDDEACAIVAAALQRGLATGADAAGGAHSLAELDYLRHNRHYGLPEPRHQIRRKDSRGRVRYLDVYYEVWQVHVEIDGGHHNDAGAQWADMRRQNDVWIRGDRVLRFPAWLVRRRPAEVFAQVRAALEAAGWRPTLKDLGRTSSPERR
jgi:very-short-patch-repair endonuclease